MSRKSSKLGVLRNARSQPNNTPKPGELVDDGVCQSQSLRLPPFDILHPVESLRQRKLVKQHQTNMLKKMIDEDRAAFANHVQEEASKQINKDRSQTLREQSENERLLVEALAQGQTRQTAMAQHFQRLTAFNTQNQIDLIEKVIKNETLRKNLIESLERQAANTFAELEALGMGEEFDPSTYGA